MEELFDVVIVGGGPVGACLAALLSRAAPGRGAPLKVAVLERERPAPVLPGGAYDLRVSAFSRASERILGAAGAWGRIAASRVCPYDRMRVWHQDVPPTSSAVLEFDAAEAGEPNLGHIVEARLVQSTLLDAAAAAGAHIEAGELVSVAVGEDSVRLQTHRGALAARLVVGADGARSALRDRLGLTVESSGYGQTAIVAMVRTERPHAHTAWQRFLNTGTLAFLPLADGSSSIVWSADEAVAQPLLAISPEDFGLALERALDSALGATRLVSERLSFPLQRLSAHRYVAHRCALVGDAAHVIHPLAGQGVNLGLADAATLAELLLNAREQSEDPGALRILRRYERWRKSETELMRLGVEAFDRLLAHGNGALAQLAQRGLGWVNGSAELKRLLIARALGASGDLPRFTRWGSDRSLPHR